MKFPPCWLLNHTDNIGNNYQRQVIHTIVTQHVQFELNRSSSESRGSGNHVMLTLFSEIRFGLARSTLIVSLIFQQIMHFRQKYSMGSFSHDGPRCSNLLKCIFPLLILHTTSKKGKENISSLLTSILVSRRSDTFAYSHASPISTDICLPVQLSVCCECDNRFVITIL